MATQAQIEANRRNAQRSTGPRSAQGKAVSSRNALKYGIEPTGLLVPVDHEHIDALVETILHDPAVSHLAGELEIRNYATAKYHLDRIEFAVGELLESEDTVDSLRKMVVLSRFESRYTATERQLQRRLYSPVRRLRSQIRNRKAILSECRLIRKNLPE